MKLSKTELNRIIDNSIMIRDEIITSDLDKDLPIRERLEREQKLARLINIAEELNAGNKIEVVE